ncbi:hypothetical protein V1512DRAFT_265700 [Lipomyces arxii]|uniref:uncharacterized protein n=1 Tax=Lipomyces arxii TaxID=56418 RepID=UPI0034CF2E1B
MARGLRMTDLTDPLLQDNHEFSEAGYWQSYLKLHRGGSGSPVAWNLTTNAYSLNPRTLHKLLEEQVVFHGDNNQHPDSVQDRRYQTNPERSTPWFGLRLVNSVVHAIRRAGLKIYTLIPSINLSSSCHCSDCDSMAHPPSWERSDFQISQSRRFFTPKSQTLYDTAFLTEEYYNLDAIRHQSWGRSLMSSWKNKIKSVFGR